MRKISNLKDSKINSLDITYNYLVCRSKKVINILSNLDKNVVIGIYIEDIEKKSIITSAAIFSNIEFCILDSFNEISSSNINFLITDNLSKNYSRIQDFKVYYEDKKFIILEVNNNIIDNTGYAYRTKIINNKKELWLDIPYEYIKTVNDATVKYINKDNICFNIDSENEYILPFLIYILLQTKGSMKLINGPTEFQNAFLKKSSFTVLILTSNQFLLMLKNNKKIEKDIIVLNDMDYINYDAIPINLDKNLLSMKTFLDSNLIWEVKKIESNITKTNKLFDNIDLSILKDSITLQKKGRDLLSPYQIGLVTLDLKKLNIRPVNYIKNSQLITNIIGRKSFNQNSFEFLGYYKEKKFYDQNFITNKVLIKLNYIKGTIFNTNDNSEIFVVKQDGLGSSSGYSLKQKLNLLVPGDRLTKNVSIITNIPLLKDNSIDFTKLRRDSLSKVMPKVDIKSIENKLKQIISEILKLDQASLNRNSNFFDIGGNSLSVIYLLHAIDNIFKEHLTIKQIFNHPTLEGISTEILKNDNTVYDYTNSKIKHKEKKIYNLSPAERQMYSIYMRKPKSTAYNLPFIIKVDKKIDNVRLISAINTIYKDNDILHTKFINTGKGIYQKVVPYPKDLTIPIVKMSKDIKQELHDFIIPFDLETGCLMRAKIAVNTNGNRYLLIDFHHIAVDGVSLVNLFKELSLLLKNQKLSSKSITYGDYSDWISKKKLESSEHFWKKYLSDTKHLKPLKTDYSRKNNSKNTANTINKRINNKIYSNIKLYCRKNQVTEFMFWISIFGLALLDYNKTNNMVIGTPIANRNSQTKDLIGMFVNVLPIKLKINKNMTVKNFIENVREMSLKAFSNSLYQVDKIVSDLGLSGNQNISPLFQASFSMQNMTQPNDELEHIDFLSIPNENTNDLTAFLFYKNGIPTFSISYKTSLYDKETIIKILNNMLNMINSLISDDSQSVYELFDKNYITNSALSMEDIEEDKNLSNLNFNF